MKTKIFQQLTEILPSLTAHLQGEKFVFLNALDCNTTLTQFAYGRFKPGEGCEEHKHPTMEEYFFFLRGAGICVIGQETYRLSPGCFIRIPSGSSHQFTATGHEPLEFVYFGIAISK